MPDTRLDVSGIGNAFVDVLSKSDDAFLADNGLDKGIMTLIDADQAERIYSRMGPGVEVSGGSAANTIAGVAAMEAISRSAAEDGSQIPVASV